MTRGVSWFIVAPLVLLGLSACQFSLFQQREPWRTEAEERCLAGGYVKPSAYIVPMRAIDGAGTCGMEHPFKIGGLNQGTVEVSPKATLACPMTASVDRWVAEDIQPAAYAWFGQPIAKIKQMSSYSCRNMNGGPAGKISEHAFGNGFDIGGFVLADGREITVKNGWKGQPDERGFLRTVHASACEHFTTVLGPGYNIYHYDHIHIDLMRRAPGRYSCQPSPQKPSPPIYKAPPYYKAPAMVGAPTYSPTQASPAEAAPENETEEMDVPAGAPMVLSPGPSAPQQAAPPATAYGHGVDPNYQPSQPYPSASAAPQTLAPQTLAPQQLSPPQQGTPYPATTYPAPVQPAPAYQPPPAATKPTRPDGIPLPPAGIPLAKWLGLDTTATGSIDKRAYAAERQFASPIPPPPTRPSGSD